MNSARNVVLGSLVAFAVLIGLLAWNPRSRSLATSAAGTLARPLLVYCAAGMKAPTEAIAKDASLSEGPLRFVASTRS